VDPLERVLEGDVAVVRHPADSGLGEKCPASESRIRRADGRATLTIPVLAILVPAPARFEDVDDVSAAIGVAFQEHR